MHREFPPVAFTAAALLLVPLPWHLRAGNVATISMTFWLFISNIIYGVDAVIWRDNVNTVIPIWCDITCKIIIGANFALPAACLCICIHLEELASVRQARVLAVDKRRRQLFEGLVCFGLPIVFMALHYVVQGHRFDIIEEYGCRPTTYISIPALFIVWIPPLVMATGTLVFAALAFRHFIHRRVSFTLHLNKSNSTLTTSRYLRLIAMSAIEMVWSIALTSYALWFTLSNIPLQPWSNWAFVHSNFSRIDIYPLAFTPQIVLTTYYVMWWMVPASSFVFVAFFVFGKDALDGYKAWYTWFKRRILRIQDAKSQGTFDSLSFVKSPLSPATSPPNVPEMSHNGTSTAESTWRPYKYRSRRSPSHSDTFDLSSQSSVSKTSLVDFESYRKLTK